VWLFGASHAGVNRKPLFAPFGGQGWEGQIILYDRYS